MTPHLITFYILAAAAIASAIAMVASKNTVHAVLFMAGNFLVTAVLYLLLHAPFLALIQVIVYAGAIMVLFLFVVMIMGPSDLPTGESLRAQRAIGLAVLGAFGLALIAAIATTPRSGEGSTVEGEAGVEWQRPDLGIDLARAAFAPDAAVPNEVAGGAYPAPPGSPVAPGSPVSPGSSVSPGSPVAPGSPTSPGSPASPGPQAPDADFGSPEAIGTLLMSGHVIPLEVVSVLLLVAMLGAVVLGQERNP